MWSVIIQFFSIVGCRYFGLAYLIPFVSFVPHFIRWRILCELSEGITEVRKKETKIPFRFQVYFWVEYGHSVAR